MLPRPASSFKRQNANNTTSRINKRLLFARSRLTNLAVVIIGFSFTCSLLLNLSYWLSTPSSSGSERRAPNSILATISRDIYAVPPTHLVIVAGHAIWNGCLPERKADVGEWILGPEVERGSASIHAFFQHITNGAELSLNDPGSLLVFSGGQTRSSSLISEAQSYFQLAHQSNVFHDPLQPWSRATTEDYALDSYQNLLFSIARFKEVTGNYPNHITVVGFGMKRKRFEELHLRAIRWPEERFDYIGIDVDGDTSSSYAGEREFGFLPYSRDLYGCHDELAQKRLSRNPFSRFHPYHSSAPELVELLDWCPGSDEFGVMDGRTQPFAGPLPWDNL